MVIVFPGQGSQFVGMGKDLYNKYDLAREIYKKSAQLIGQEYIDVSFDGDADTLKNTRYSQPAIFLYSYILGKILFSQKSEIKPDYFAGHSLGEITALAFANYFEFEDAVKFVRFRGEVMYEASVEDGGMYALLFPDVEGIKNEMVNYINRCYVANYNSYAQVVISGLKSDLSEFVNKFKGKLFKKSIELKVSAPFHTPFLNETYDKIKKELEKYKLDPSSRKVFSNYSGDIYPVSENEAKEYIARQVISPVRWIDIIEKCKNMGEDQFVEIGPKKVLVSFITNINKQAKCEVYSKLSSSLPLP